MAARPLHVLSLCSGVGMLDLGIKLATGGRARTVGYVERDSFATSALVARMEEEVLDQALVWDDLCTFDGSPWRGSVDLVAAGFPCQPYADSGKKRGANDDRDLWPDVARIVREVRPNGVLLENVRGALRHPDGLERWLGDLAGLGFDARWGVLGARDVGAPHRRDRLFVLAKRVPNASGIPIRNEPERGRGAAQPAEPRDTKPGDLGSDVADSDRGRRQGEWVQELQGVEGQPGREPDGHDPHRGLLWPPGPNDERWAQIPPEAQPAIRGVADGSPERVDRLRALGNGVVPLVVANAVRLLGGL